MGDVANQWPSFAIDGSLAKFHAAKAKAKSADGEVVDPATAEDEPRTLDVPRTETILERLETADRERQALLKNTQLMNDRVQTLEESLGKANDASQAMLESLEICFADIRTQESRLSPRLEKLEEEAAEFASQIAKTNEDVLSAAQANESLSEDAISARAQSQRMKSELTDRVATLSTDFDEVRERVAALSEGAEHSTVEIAAISEELSAAVQELADSQRAATDIATDLQAARDVEERLESRLDSKFDRMSQAVTTVAAAVTSSSREVKQLAAELSDVRDVTAREIGGLADEVQATAELSASALEAADSHLVAADLARDLEAAVEQTRAARERLETEMSTVSDGLAAQSRLVAGVADSNAEIGELVAELFVAKETAAGELSDVSSALGDSNEHIEKLVEELAAARNAAAEKIDELAGEVHLVTGLAREAEVTAKQAERRLATEVASVSEDVAVHRQRVVEVAASTLQMEQRVADLADANEAVAGDVKGLRKRVGEAEERLSAAQLEAVGATDGNVSSTEIEELVAGLAEARDATTQELGGLTDEVHAAADLAREAHQTARSVEERLEVEVASVSEDVATQDERVAAVAASNTQIVELVSDLVDAHDETAREIGGLTNEVAAQRKLVGEVEQRWGNEVASVSEDIATQRQRVSAVADSNTELEELVTELAEVKQTTARDIGGLAEEVQAAADLARGAQETANKAERRVIEEVTAVTEVVASVEADVAGVSSAVNESNRQVDELVAGLAQSKEATAIEIGGLTEEGHAAVDLARGAQETAEKAEDRAEYSAQVGDALRVDFNAEVKEVRAELEERARVGDVSRVAAEGEVAQNGIRRRLATAQERLDKLEAETGRPAAPVSDPAELMDDVLSEVAVPPKAQHADAHRDRWDGHVRAQAALRKKRKS